MRVRSGMGKRICQQAVRPAGNAAEGPGRKNPQAAVGQSAGPLYRDQMLLVVRTVWMLRKAERVLIRSP